MQTRHKTTNAAILKGTISAKKFKASSTSDTEGAPLVVLHRTFAASAVEQDITVARGLRVIGFRFILTAAGASGDTLQVQDAADNPVTDALDLNSSEDVVVVAGTIDNSFATFEAGEVLSLTPAGSLTGDAFIYCLCV